VIGLDANVLVRHFAQDDPVQSPKATHLIEQVLTPKSPGFISIVALVETVWVLRRIYRLGDQALATVIERVLQVGVFVVEAEAEVFTAMVALRQGRGSFSDALIAAIGTTAGCVHTATFDRKAARLPGFQLL
jgi:predicted nucleic-acid-binding protein